VSHCLRDLGLDLIELFCWGNVLYLRVLLGVLPPSSGLGVGLPVEFNVFVGHESVVNTRHDSDVPLILDQMRLFKYLNQLRVKGNCVVIFFRVIASEFIIPANPVLINRLFGVRMRYFVNRNIVLITK
jgi:hypothetical protein